MIILFKGIGNSELQPSSFAKENYNNLNSFRPRGKTIIILMQGKVGNNELELSSFAKEKNVLYVTHSGPEVR